MSLTRLTPGAKTNLKMKFFLVLATLFAAAQAHFSVGAPAASATLHPGQNVNVQIIAPINTVSYMLRCGVCYLRLSRAYLQGKWTSASSLASSPVDHLPALRHQPTWVKFHSWGNTSPRVKLATRSTRSKTSLLSFPATYPARLLSKCSVSPYSRHQ